MCIVILEGGGSCQQVCFDLWVFVEFFEVYSCASPLSFILNKGAVQCPFV